MIPDVRISECSAEEADDSVKALWLGLAREMFEIEHFTVPSEINGSVWVKLVREGLTSGKNFLLVAKNKNKLVGFAYASIFRDYPFVVSELVGAINDVYVSPEYRGKGIGKKLLAECLSKLKAKGVNSVRVTVLTESKAANKLYEKSGFKVSKYGMIKTLRH